MEVKEVTYKTICDICGAKETDSFINLRKTKGWVVYYSTRTDSDTTEDFRIELCKKCENKKGLKPKLLSNINPKHLELEVEEAGGFNIGKDGYIKLRMKWGMETMKKIKKGTKAFLLVEYE